MQSLSYVIAAYLTALILIGVFTCRVVLQRLKLRQLLSALEKSDGSKF